MIRKGSGSLQVKIAGLGSRASTSPLGAVSDSLDGFLLLKSLFFFAKPANPDWNS
jgi:hypothetical protein